MIDEEFIEFTLPLKCPIHTAVRILGNPCKKIKVKLNKGQVIFAYGSRTSEDSDEGIETCSKGTPLSLICIKTDEEFIVSDCNNLIKVM